MKAHRLFIAIFLAIHWVKPAWPVKSILLILTLLIGGPCGRRKDTRQNEKVVAKQ